MNMPLGLSRYARIRRLAIVALVCATAMIPPMRHNGQAEESQVRIEWKIPAPQVEDAQKRLALPAQPVPGNDTSRGQPLFYLLAGAASLPSVVDAIILLYRDVVYGGVVIDACNDRLEIHNDRSIPGKVMVVRCADKITPLYLASDVQSPDLVKVLSNAVPRK